MGDMNPDFPWDDADEFAFLKEIDDRSSDQEIKTVWELVSEWILVRAEALEGTDHEDDLGFPRLDEFRRTLILANIYEQRAPAELAALTRVHVQTLETCRAIYVANERDGVLRIDHVGRVMDAIIGMFRGAKVPQ